MLFVTYMTEPGIIPARIWGNVLPAKYKGVDVIKDFSAFRTLVLVYFIIQCVKATLSLS